MKNIFKSSILWLLILSLPACSQKRKEPDTFSDQAPAVKDSIFKSPYGGYGYDILVNGKIAIHQPHIPIIAGNIGFASATDARRTAQLVITKLKQNQFPPVLVSQELKDLGIIP